MLNLQALASSTVPDLQTLAANAPPNLRRKLLRDHRAQELRARIKACRKCELGHYRKHAVPWSGPLTARLAFVGEGPGRQEDETGVPFVGRAGTLFDKILVWVEIARDEVFVCNTLCCRPPQNRDPLHVETEACRPNLEDQLEISGCWMVVLLGRSALSAVKGIHGKFTMKGEHGKFFWRDGRVYMATYHPAAALRDATLSRVIAEDVALALAVREEEMGALVLSKQTADLETGLNIQGLLEDRGYAQVWSKVLGTHVMYLRNRDVQVPEALAHLPSYTVMELAKLGQVGRGRKVTEEDMRRIHLVKKRLGGEVMV